MEFSSQKWNYFFNYSLKNSEVNYLIDTFSEGLKKYF